MFTKPGRALRCFPWLAAGVAAAALSSATCCAWGQAPGAGRSLEIETSPPRAWVEAAAANEERIIDDDGSFPLRYRMRKIDAKNDITRDIIETRQGTVARLVQRNGKPITAAEDALERERLKAMLASPSEFARHHKRDNAARGYSMALVKKLPSAMIFTYVPGQPQPDGSSGHSTQIVIDFKPDPAFKPEAMIENVLTGLEGRVWIDRKSQRVTRIEGRVLRPVDFGWGVLARIYPGGTVEFEQANAGGDRWAYSHVKEDLTMREMMVRTVQQHAEMDTSDFQILPAPVSYQEAIHILLATPIPLL